MSWRQGERRSWQERSGHEIRRIDCPVPVVAQASPGPLFRERAGSDERTAVARFRLMEFRFSPSPLTSQAKLCPWAIWPVIVRGQVEDLEAASGRGTGIVRASLCSELRRAISAR